MFYTLPLLYFVAWLGVLSLSFYFTIFFVCSGRQKPYCDEKQWPSLPAAVVENRRAKHNFSNDVVGRAVDWAIRYQSQSWQPHVWPLTSRVCFNLRSSRISLISTDPSDAVLALSIAKNAFAMCSVESEPFDTNAGTLTTRPYSTCKRFSFCVTQFVLPSRSCSHWTRKA